MIPCPTTSVFLTLDSNLLCSLYSSLSFSLLSLKKTTPSCNTSLVLKHLCYSVWCSSSNQSLHSFQQRYQLFCHSDMLFIYPQFPKGKEGLLFCSLQKFTIFHTPLSAEQWQKEYIVSDLDLNLEISIC